jgi:ArsR family transcriptional regulator, virulence genes transcriptional regulator
MPDAMNLVAREPTPDAVLRMADQAEAAAALLKALAHAQRLMILCHLSTGPKTVSEIEDRIGARQSAVSQHLARLRQDGLVTAERRGKSIGYDIADPAVRQVIELLYGLYCKP